MMRNSATPLLRVCEVCRVSSLPRSNNAPYPTHKIQPACVPLPLSGAACRSRIGRSLFDLRDCEVCEVSYYPREKLGKRSIFIYESALDLANLAVPQACLRRSRAWVLLGATLMRVIRAHLSGRGWGYEIGNVQRAGTGPSCEDLDLDNFDLDDLDLDDLNPETLDQDDLDGLDLDDLDLDDPDGAAIDCASASWPTRGGGVDAA